jgi:hypothetical protein
VTKVNYVLACVAMCFVFLCCSICHFETMAFFHISPIWMLIGCAALMIYLFILMFGKGFAWSCFAFPQLVAVTALGLYITGVWFHSPVALTGKWEGYQQSNTARFNGGVTTLLLDGQESLGTFKAVTTLEDHSRIRQSGRWESGTDHNTVSSAGRSRPNSLPRC